MRFRFTNLILLFTFTFLGIIRSNFLYSQEYYACDCLLPEKYAPAVSSTEKLPVLSLPDGKVLKVFQFGQEKMVNLDIMSDYKGVKYKKVRTGDGAEGWVAANSITLCGQGRVVRQNTRSFKDSLQTEKGASFFSAEPVIITKTQFQMALTESKDKKRKGWLPVEYLMEGDKEVAYALEFDRIMSEPASERKLNDMELLKNKAKGSEMLGYIEEQYFYLKKMSSLPAAVVAERGGEASKVVQTPPQKSVETKPQPKVLPKEKAVIKEKLLTASSGNKSIVSTKDPSASVSNSATAERSVPVIAGIQREKQQMGNNVYWKNKGDLKLVITNQDSDELTCYHPFLPVNSVIYIPVPDNSGKIALRVIGKSRENDKLFISQKTADRIFGEAIPDFTEIIYFTK